MEHFVTLFDSLFLPQGIALHFSMQRHVKDYTLWILCVDDNTYEILMQLNLPNIRLLQLSALETNELTAVKPKRTKGEYCWTLTPFSPRFVFEVDSTIERVTYIDADMWFRKSPIPIFHEFEESGKNVLITDHAYAAEYDLSAISGQYCVQFMIFNRHKSEPIRKWWEERCLEWCYARAEDGKFGDQKYLDNWPGIFSKDVHVAQNKEWFLAPWNAIRFPYGNAILWHFHGVRLYRSWGKYKIVLGSYPLLQVTIKNVYSLYGKDISNALTLLTKTDYQFINQINLTFIKRLHIFLTVLKHKVWGRMYKRQTIDVS
jgi:hypothetical protein